MIRVLIAESSATTREALLKAAQSDQQIIVVGLAKDGLEAVTLTKRLRPDLLLIGVRLQKIDGFEATKEIMIEDPTPIVLVTSEPDGHDVEVSVLALRAGALAVVAAPKGDGADVDRTQNLLSTVRAMSEVKVVRRWRERSRREPPQPRRGALPPRIVAVAASTGGPAALETLLAELPGNFSAPMLIVQHISNGFVDGVVSWLNRVSSLKVKVAEDSERLEAHTVYLAPDDRHLGVTSGSRIVLANDAPIDGFRPSASYLFASAARNFGPGALAIILTGMGRDGVDGLCEVHKAGGRVIAQDEASSVVFGMPRAAIDANVVHQVLPLGEIAPAMTCMVGAAVGDNR